MLIFIEFSEVLRRLGNDAFEVLSGPLNGMLDLVGEILQRAKRDSFFWRINDIIITLGFMRNNDL